MCLVLENLCPVCLFNLFKKCTFFPFSNIYYFQHYMWVASQCFHALIFFPEPVSLNGLMLSLIAKNSSMDYGLKAPLLYSNQKK